MNQSAQKKEALECKICINPFSDTIESNIPRILGCGHTICHSCAESLQKVSLDKFSIRCPFDRQITANFYGNVEKLLRNYAIIDLIQARNEEADRAEEIKAPEICEDPIVPCYENPKHESTKYCQACEVDFCESCFLSVHSSKILSNHQSVPISEKPIRRQNCPNHPDSIADHFCDDVNCKTTSPFCCETCRQDLHKDHAMILTEVKADKLERELTDLLKALDSFAIQAIQRGGTLDKTKICIQNIENLEAECQNMLTAIEEHFERKKMEASQKLINFRDSKFIYMENKEAIENGLELIKKSKMDIVKVLKRKEILFADETIDFEKIYYGLNRVKHVDLVPLPMPTLEEIINSNSSTPSSAPPNDSPAPPPTRTLRDLFSFSKFRFF
ncbi:hypothetical protein CAEBREN_22293 [Caenorhabditis brenneri]|uniref:RING-type domain-containing protein n=1 Tax=Caenorhabditis brenneri TaxID=135651 RepID=G0N3R5_CAEBE|nr:hypothetical protein CAEBREN_22293 [Caenorhabditis brenneri]